MYPTPMRGLVAYWVFTLACLFVILVKNPVLVDIRFARVACELVDLCRWMTLVDPLSSR